MLLWVSVPHPKVGDGHLRPCRVSVTAFTSMWMPPVTFASSQLTPLNVQKEGIFPFTGVELYSLSMSTWTGSHLNPAALL